MQRTSQIDELKALLPQCLLPDQLRIGLRLAGWIARGSRAERPAAPLDRWLAEARASVARRQERLERLPAIQYPDLPISAKRREIVEAIRTHQVLIIAGETGSGKTTQIPKMYLEAGLGVRAKIGCTQPRRVAALSLSRRLAEELHVSWGREVGCKIRFSDHSSPASYIKFMTDGILLAEMQNDPFLSEYEAIIIDEAHERSLNIDFLLGHLQQLLPKRTDLKLIITSATIDTQAFSQAFHHAPIIEVSGRLFPVQVIYAPIDEHSEETGETTYVDAAVQAVTQILEETTRGDMLVFLPGERDIRETHDALQQRKGETVDIIPLFGRLSAEEQQRVFAPALRRKIVVATNIAETSLTVPGIRYVVDTGLARISRYNPRTRTKRLPIEPVSQSSANQRQGRCGRVAEGVCIRLYAEADLLERPLYTQPEIQRANLAEVILRMKAFKLGDIETFPFLNPPTPQAIQGGYQLLQELGALDEHRELTEIGWDLARLPVDPTIGRMILQARKENALTEVIVIAAGLSIQDPRERPVEKKETAAAAQRRFLDPHSDFLSLLHIWNAYHDTLDSLQTQSQARKFCKTHFLSYLRMREWRDIHAQLEDVLAELGEDSRNLKPADYTAIHRSILTGLWGHVAVRQEPNLYRLSSNRQAMVFPGSGLFMRTAKPARGKTSPAPSESNPEKTKPPHWLVAGEIFETSRLFLRTVAEIDPLWIVELASHLCQRHYDEPYWEPRSGRILATEHITLNGLEVLDHTIPFQQVDPIQATQIFIRTALVEERLREHFLSPRLESSSPGRQPAARRLPSLYQFLDHNHQLRQKLEIWQTRLQHRAAPDLDEAFFQFYAQQLENVASVHDLNRSLREQQKTRPQFLQLTAGDLLGEKAKDLDLAAFPDTIPVGNQQVAVSYAYAPGEDKDGVTLKLPVTLAQVIEPNLLDWAVPGLREEQILHLLQSLPKAIRRALMPLPVKAREMAAAVEPHGASFLPQLSQYVHQYYHVIVPDSAWSITQLPAHLRPRLEILRKDQSLLATGRDLQQLRDQLDHHTTPAESHAWQKAVQQWERYGLKDWSFNDLPNQIHVADVAGFPWLAYPALTVEDNDVCLRLFQKQEQAAAANYQGIPALAEKVLQRELGWLQKDLRTLNQLKDLYVTLGPADELESTAFDNLRAYLLRRKPLPPLSREGFSVFIQQARELLPGLVPRFVTWVRTILQSRQEILLCRKPYPGMRQELDALVPRQFLKHVPFERLIHITRYLKALLIRAERAALSPAKDAEKVKHVQPYVDALRHYVTRPQLNEDTRQQLHEFRWLIEEYKVSCFAQELGTAEPVSPRRLEDKLKRLAEMIPGNKQ